METVKIVVEVMGGIVTIGDIAAPPGLSVRITIRDYDSAHDADPENEDLVEDGTGNLCFESVLEHPGEAEQPGFI